MDKTVRLIVEEVECTPNVKIYVISLGANKAFLATHLFDDNGDGNMELLNNEQLEQIQNKFLELSLPNVCNLVVVFKCRASHGYIDSILELKSKNYYDYIHECCFRNQIIRQKVLISKC
jgi:hypothetical protein